MGYDPLLGPTIQVQWCIVVCILICILLILRLLEAFDWVDVSVLNPRHSDAAQTGRWTHCGWQRDLYTLSQKLNQDVFDKDCVIVKTF